MVLRKWLVRVFLLVIMLILGGAYYVYGQYTNPEAIAQMVLAELKQHFPEADVQLGHAEWRLFSGVQLTDLRVTPKDHPSQQPVAVLKQTSLKIDKAQAAQGKFELLRVQLDQPVLNLERDPEGRWNVLSLLTAKPKASGSIPFVTLSKGTIRFHDRRLDFPVLELTNVDARLTPQPQGILTGEGQGHSALLGLIQFRFSHDPQQDRTELMLTMPQIEYQPRLEEIIVKLIPTWQEQQIRVRGVISLETKLTWYPHQDIPIVESTLKLTAGELRHPRLPVPLRTIHADLDYHPDHLEIRSFSARADQGTVSGHGHVDLASDIRRYQEHEASLHVDYENLHLHKGIYPSLPPVLRKFCEEMQAQGLLSGTLDLNWKRQKLGIAYTLKPHQGTFEADDFPYPASNIAGVLQYQEQGDTPVLQVDLRGQFGSRPFTLNGQLMGMGLRPDNDLKPGLDLKIHAENMPLDDTLYRALEPYPETHRVIMQFHAGGKIDCDLRLHRDAAQASTDRPVFQRWVSANLKDVQFRFEPFPCPMEKVQAKLDIYPNKTWRISRFTGEHRGGQVNGQAWMVGTTAGDVLHIDLLAKQLPFSSELFAALPEEVQSVWKHFKPSGKADCKVCFDKLEKGKPNIDVTITARGGSIQPACFAYQLNNLQGTFRYANNEVVISPLTAEHGATTLTIDGGHVTLRKGAGFFVQLQGVNFNDIAVDDDLLKALPTMLRDSVAALKPDKPMKVRVNLDVDDPGEAQAARLAWNGSIEINHCNLQCGTTLEDVTGVILLEDGKYNEDNHGSLKCVGQFYARSMNVAGKQVIGPLHSNLLLTKNELQLHECQVSLPGGGIKGLIEVKFGGTPRYSIDLNGDVRLEEMLDQSKGLKGRAKAALRLQGEGSDLRKLSGEGMVSVEQGAHLYKLPLIIDIFNQFSQLLPQATNFQSAKVDFYVQGDRIIARQLQLLGDAYRVEGTGGAKIDGTNLDLVLTLVMGGGRTLPLMPAMLDTLQKTIAKGLMKVRVTGSVSKVEVHVEPVPFITEPFREVFKGAGR